MKRVQLLLLLIVVIFASCTKPSYLDLDGPQKPIVPEKPEEPTNPYDTTILSVSKWFNRLDSTAFEGFDTIKVTPNKEFNLKVKSTYSYGVRIIRKGQTQDSAYKIYWTDNILKIHQVNKSLSAPSLDVFSPLKTKVEKAVVLGDSVYLCNFGNNSIIIKDILQKPQNLLFYQQEFTDLQSDNFIGIEYLGYYAKYIKDSLAYKNYAISLKFRVKLKEGTPNQKDFGLRINVPVLKDSIAIPPVVDTIVTPPLIDTTVVRIEKDYNHWEKTTNSTVGHGYVATINHWYRYGAKIVRKSGAIDEVSTVYTTKNLIQAIGTDKPLMVHSLSSFSKDSLSIAKTTFSDYDIFKFSFKDCSFTLKDVSQKPEKIKIFNTEAWNVEGNSIDNMEYVDHMATFVKDSTNHSLFLVTLHCQAKLKDGINNYVSFAVPLYAWVRKKTTTPDPKPDPEPEVPSRWKVDVAKTKLYGGVTRIFTKDNTAQTCASVILEDGVAINIDNTEWQVFNWNQIEKPTGRVAAAQNPYNLWIPARFAETTDKANWGYYNMSTGDKAARSIAKTQALAKGVSNPDVLAGKDYFFHINGDISIEYIINNVKTTIVLK